MNDPSRGQSPQEVAAQIRAAYKGKPGRGAEVLVSYLADKVEILHEPRLPGDGIRDGAGLRAMRLRETVAFQKALKGFREAAEVTVDGDYVLVALTLSGQRANGDDVAETVTSKFRIANGQIVGMVAVPRSTSFSVLRDVLREGGFTG